MNIVYQKREQIPVDAAVVSFIVKDKAAAEELLSLVDRKAAVAFYDETPDSEDVTAAVGKVRDLEEKLTRYTEEKSVKNFQAKNITCRFCGSSLAKDYLKNDICPVCEHDLRVQTVIDGELQLKQKIEDAKCALELQKDINRLKNGKVLWLCNTAEMYAEVSNDEIGSVNDIE